MCANMQAGLRKVYAYYSDIGIQKVLRYIGVCVYKAVDLKINSISPTQVKNFPKK